MWVRHTLAPALAVAIASSGSALAHAPVLSSEEGRIAICIHSSARGHNWLERSLWALRDTEGGWTGAAVLNTNGSYDLGPLQVNSWWVPKLATMLGWRDEEVAAWLRDDPCFNVEVARWIFLSSLLQTRDFWTAIGLYHSRNLRLRTTYAHTVWLRYRRRFEQRAMTAISAAPRSTKPPP